MRTRNETILVQSRRPPTVEIDTAAGAAYVRFEREDTRVARTEQIDRPGYPMVTVDYDKRGKPIGVELLGVVEFSIAKLLELAQIEAPHADLNRVRYFGAGHLEREMVATG